MCVPTVVSSQPRIRSTQKNNKQTGHQLVADQSGPTRTNRCTYVITHLAGKFSGVVSSSPRKGPRQGITYLSIVNGFTSLLNGALLTPVSRPFCPFPVRGAWGTCGPPTFASRPLCAVWFFLPVLVQRSLPSVGAKKAQPAQASGRSPAWECCQ